MVGGWVDWIEENEAVGMSYWTLLWVGGWVGRTYYSSPLVRREE